MKEDIKKRDSNLECCRIITMAIIVLNHVVSLGGGGILPENIIKLYCVNGIFARWKIWNECICNSRSLLPV